MKKIFISLFLALITSLVFLAGCGKDTSNTAEATPDEAQSAKKEILEFGKDNYNDSIQVNQEKIDWAAYDELPKSVNLDTVLELFNNDSGKVMDAPNWEKKEFNDSVILNNDPDFIIVTFRDSPKEIFMDSIKNIKEWKDLTSFKVESTHVENINEYKATINKGVCYLNNKDKNEKLFTSCILENDHESFCLIAVTQDKADHTVDMLNDTIRKMAKSIISIETEDVLEQETEDTTNQED